MIKNITTIIEYTETHVKLLRTHLSRGQMTVAACEVQALADSTDAQLQKATMNLILRQRIREDELLVILPRKHAILKQLELPSTDAKEIQQMVELQLVPLIPYALEEVVFQYHFLEQTAQGYTKVLVTVMNQQWIKRYLRVLNDCGVRANNVTINSFGFSQWWEQQLRVDERLEDVSTVLLAIDYTSSDLVFFDKFKLWFSRNIEVGYKQLINASWFEFEEQLARSIASYQKAHMGGAIKQVKIICDAPEAQTLCQHLQEKLRLAITVIPAQSQLAMSKAVRLKIAAYSGVSLVAGAGFLANFPKELINLLPPAVKEYKLTKQRNLQIVQLIAGFVLMAFLMIAYACVGVHFKNKELKDIQEQLQKIQPLLVSKEEKQQFIDEIKNRMAKKVFVPAILVEVEKLVVPEISLRSLSIDNQNNVIIMGYGDSGSVVNMFQSRLVQSPRFENVGLQFATKRRIYNLEVTDFKITAKVKME